MIDAEVAIYPLKTSDATVVINNSIKTLGNTNVIYNVNSISTHIKGSKEEVFSSLEKMFTEAERSGGEVSMVVTITNCAS